MDRQYIRFRDMPLRTLFTFNGVEYQKTSVRTARLVHYNKMVIQFSQHEFCIVGWHSIIDERAAGATYGHHQATSNSVDGKNHSVG